jgi:hypothetical protein
MNGYFEGGEPIELFGHRGRLLNELIWHKEGWKFRVPAGFVYDGASIPDFAWSIVGHPFMRGYRRPAALHDWMCREKLWPSHIVHDMFYDCLRAEGVSWWRAKLMHYAVANFGPKW